MPRLKTWVCVIVYKTGSRSFLVTHSEEEVKRAEEAGYRCRRVRMSLEGHENL